MSDEWSFEANLGRGHLPTGEPLECLYGAGWWTEEPPQYPEPPIVQCVHCGGRAYDLGDGLIDCENCGKIQNAMSQIKIGDEVQSPQGGVSGIVFSIADGMTHIVNEYGERYALQRVQRCARLTPRQKGLIIAFQDIEVE